MGILLVSLGLVAAVLCVGGALVYEALQTRVRTWREAAAAVGMTELVESKGFLGVTTELRGRVRDLRVRFELYGTIGHVDGTRVFISGLGKALWESPSRLPLPGTTDASWGSPTRFHLRAEGVGSALAKALGERELVIGDEEFDTTAYILGPPSLVLAVLDADTRGLLLSLLRGEAPSTEPPSETVPKARVTVEDGVLCASFPDPRSRPAAVNLPEAVTRLVVVAQRLTSPDDVPQRLAHNVRNDPVPGVRLSNLVALAQHYPDEDVTREALRAACQDADDEVRLRAAVALGEEARDVLMKIASNPGGPAAPLFRDAAADSRAARAIEAVGASLTVSEAGELLRGSLEGIRPDAARAAIHVLGRLEEEDVVPLLRSALESEDTDVACAAARSLGLAGGETAESALIAVLEHDDPLVQRAAASALGRCGTAAAVKPLQGLSGPFNLGPTARQAIAEIQARLTGATPGQLALADGESGQLSLSEEGLEGRVAIVRETETAAEGDVQWPTDATGDEASRDATSPAEDEESSATSPATPPKTERE